MKRCLKASILWAGAICCLLAAGAYFVLPRDPKPIRIDPRIYGIYVGFYDFGNGFIATVRQDGNRLMLDAPERATRELLPETETQFFHKGSTGRYVFGQIESGRAESLVFHDKRFSHQAVRISEMPSVPAYTNGIVVATTGGAAVQAGLEVLKEGGTAADAALTTALCQVTHAGGSYVSFAGLMLMLYYEAGSGKVHFLNAPFQVPLAETNALSIPKTGGRTALVPGFMAGVQAAHGRFGKVSFQRLFQPAIALAEKGEPVSSVMAWWINSKKSVLSQHPETKRIFTKADGTFYSEGDLFKQTELAETLRKIAAHGAGYLYTGEWGRRFIEAVQKNGGRMTLEDLARYHVKWEAPIETMYGKYQVYGPGLSAWGGVHTIEALNLLELADLKRSGIYLNSPKSLLWMMQIAACHKLTWVQQKIADYDLSPQSRINKKTAQWIWNQMQEGKWPWLPEKLKTSKLGSHSDAIVVVDQKGNMAVIGHTINTELWGKTGIFVDGISIPDPAGNQQREVGIAGSGNALPNGMSPLIVFYNNRPMLGSSVIGGGLHYKSIQVLSSILDFGVEALAAVDQPAFSSDGVEEGAFEPELLKGVEKLGMKVRVLSPDKYIRGYWAGVQIDLESGRLKGGVSRGLEGEIRGY